MKTMIKTGLLIIKEALEKYYSNGWFWLLLLLAVLYLLFLRPKKQLIRFVALYAVFYCAVILNPACSALLTRLGLDGVYWRVFWFIPAGILTAYALTDLVCRTKNRMKKNILVILFCAILIVSGGWMYTKENFQLSENLYKIPQYVVDVNEKLEDGCRIMGDDSIIIWIRTLNPTITMPYGRQAILNGGSKQQNTLHRLWSKPVLNVRRLIRMGRRLKCDYLVVDQTRELSEPWETYGLTLAAQTDQYNIYAL